MDPQDPREIERLVYHWCTQAARGTPSARALAAVYASTYMDSLALVRFSDLKALDDTRMEWALSLMRAHITGTLQVPWARAVALVALYDLLPQESEPEVVEV